MGDNDYKFVKELGSGSFGTTWLAKNKKSGEKVAIKIFGNVTMKERQKESAREDWMHELKMLKALLESCHPYAVCIVDSYLEEGIPRLVMDFVNGESLSKQMEKWPRNKKQGAILAHDLIKGIEIIHSHGVVHEDIKGDNIIWDKTMKQYRYIDFGLACRKRTPTVNLKTAKFPCGTYGTKYIASPDMEARRQSSKSVVPWAMLQAHDYWAIGLEILRWHTFEDYDGFYIDQYEDWAGKPPSASLVKSISLNSWGPLYWKMDPEFIQYQIEKIWNDDIRFICMSLLEFDGKKRFNNFKTVAKCINNA